MLFLYGGAKRARRRASHRIAKLRGQLRCSFSLAPDYGSLTGKAPISPSAGALPLPCKQTNVALLFFSLSESLLTSDSPPHHKHTHTQTLHSRIGECCVQSPQSIHISDIPILTIIHIRGSRIDLKMSPIFRRRSSRLRGSSATPGKVRKDFASFTIAQARVNLYCN
jgi:hypothetical protein